MRDAQREIIADELEMRGSPLCDCAEAGPATSPTNGAAVAHHCWCTAVRASAMARQAASRTRHSRECGCSEADRSASLFWEHEFAARTPGRQFPNSGS
ncbi:hypothetical protein ACQP1W_07010 [Spirillospora sp. CA-255316]